MSERTDPDDLAGAYALNAIDAGDRALFEQRLADSEQLRAEAGELADTAAILGLAISAEQPPASLRDRVLAQAARTPQVPAPTPGAAERRARARWFRESIAAVASAAAAIALIGGGLLANVTLQNSAQQAQADRLAAINAADDTQRLVADVAGGGTATLLRSADLGLSALIVDGVAELPVDRVYELWYIDDAGARPAGTFRVSADGTAWRVLAGDMDGDDVVGVTIEPSGGSSTPTTDPIVLVGA